MLPPAAQELSKQGSIDSGRRPSGNHLDRILESESFQQTAVLLAGSDFELSSPSLACAEMLARMAAADVGATTYIRSLGLDPACPEARTPADLCRQPRGADALDELRTMPPLLRHLLWRFASLSYTPPPKRGEKRGALRKRPDDDAAQFARALSLLPVLGVLFGAHPLSDVATLSTWQRRFAIMLVLGDGGLSEKVFNQVRAELNLTSTRTARRIIDDASRSLVGRHVLTNALPDELRPSATDVPLFCESVDNANATRDGKERTKLGLGTTYLGQNMSEADAKLLADCKAGLLPKPDATTVEMVPLTAGDKEVLASVGRLQDMQALQYAAQQLREQERARGCPQPGAAARATSTSIAVGDDVTLLDRNRNSLTAKVTAVNSSTGVASVTILHGGGVEEACDKDVSLLTKVQPPGSPGQAQTAAPTPATNRRLPTMPSGPTWKRCRALTWPTTWSIRWSRAGRRSWDRCSRPCSAARATAATSQRGICW